MTQPCDEPYATWAPPGHYYSPLPAADEVKADADRIFGRDPLRVPGVDLRVPAQHELLKDLATLDTSLPWSPDRDAANRYWHDNPFFSYGDGLFLYLMLRKLRPRRLIEVGSGFTSSLVLDVNERFLRRSMTCTFIDPHPERLQELLRPEDHAVTRVITTRVQDAPADAFLALENNDVLLIDSTHVSKVGSDVNLLFFDVLPSLAPGVVVHVHDVFPGFEYPRAWIEEGRAWNENYLLRAFLQFNSAFEIVLHPNLMHRIAKDTLYSLFDLSGRNIGGSIWLRRRPEPGGTASRST